MDKTKKFAFIIFLLSVVLCLVPANVIAATTPTVKPSQNQISTNSADLEKIQRIKDIVASKVAELKLVEKRGFIAKATDITNSQVTATDTKGNTRYIDIDELTKFDVTSKGSSGISDMEKGVNYSFVGLYNKESQRLLARKISSVKSLPIYFEGSVVSVDEDEYQIQIVNEKGEKKTVDIQNSTKTNLASVEGDLTKSGFSKIALNDRVLAIGFLDKKDETLIAALRVIHFEDIPPSKEMQSYVKLPTPTPAGSEE